MKPATRRKRRQRKNERTRQTAEHRTIRSLNHQVECLKSESRNFKRERDNAKRRLAAIESAPTPHGAAVVMANTVSGRYGEEIVAAMRFSPRQIALMAMNRHEAATYSVRRIAAEVCRKAEEDLEQLLLRILTGIG